MTVFRSAGSIAIIADIHANLEALHSVLADIREQGVTVTYCLGDIIGYGPDPKECLEIIRRLKILSLRGNHDSAVANLDYLKRMSFNEEAVQSILWTAKQLDDEDRKYLDGLPYSIEFPSGLVLTHSSLHEPAGYEYIDPDHPDGINNLWETFLEIGERNLKFCFLGHAHTPALWGFVGYQEERLELPRESEILKDQVSRYKFRIRNYEKLICSVGSVGQPRDRDPRACYAIFDRKSVVFRRVPYDMAKTAAKIRKNPELCGSLAARLFSAL